MPAPRTWQRILTAIAGLLSPLSLLTMLTALTMVNPMGLAFLTEFTVVNETSEDVWITPIGAIGQAGRRSTLPYSRFRNLVVLSTEDREFQIAARSSRSFVYDWDDIQFCEILIRSEEGAYRILPTGLHPTQRQYCRPETDRFVITNLVELEPATELQLAALESRRGRRIQIIYGLACLGLMPPLLLYFTINPQRKRPASSRRNDSRPAAPIFVDEETN